MTRLGLLGVLAPWGDAAEQAPTHIARTHTCDGVAGTLYPHMAKGEELSSLHPLVRALIPPGAPLMVSKVSYFTGLVST